MMKRRSGFTLLEVMLALGLSLVLMAAIGAAITTYFRLFDSGRTNIEEAQLARALLRRMADDIRGTVFNNAVDFSKLTEGTGTEGTGTEGTGTEGTGTEGTGMACSDLSSSGPQLIGGLYGNSYQLQIDVSRLPRVDQYMLTADQGVNNSTNQIAGIMPSDRVSDLKNIAYYIFGDTTSLSLGADPEMQLGCGLVRREMDRASALFSSQYGGEADLEAAADLIAPEVASVQFAYFDGLTWYDSWDSTEYGGLPLAVQITLAIARPAKRSGEIPPPGIYSLVVNIPTAKVPGSTDSSSSQSNTQNNQQNDQQNNEPNNPPQNNEGPAQNAQENGQRSSPTRGR